MAIMPQISFDVWNEFDELGDLERPRLVISLEYHIGRCRIPTPLNTGADKKT